MHGWNVRSVCCLLVADSGAKPSQAAAKLLTVRLSVSLIEEDAHATFLTLRISSDFSKLLISES